MVANGYGEGDESGRRDGNVARVACFLDIPNLETSLREVGERLDAAAVRRIAEGRGRVVALFAYGTAVASRPVTRGAISAAQSGFEFVPRVLFEEGRKDIDTQMTADIVELACNDEVDLVVVGSGDSDYLPAVRAARRRGKAVVVVAVRGCCSSTLADLADEVVLLGGVELTSEPVAQSIPENGIHVVLEAQPGVVIGRDES